MPYAIVGKPVNPPAGAATAHEYVTPSGKRIVVARDARGRLLPGSRLTEVRTPDQMGRPVVHAESAVKRALGLPVNPWRKAK